jgi:hypothetical protein
VLAPHGRERGLHLDAVRRTLQDTPQPTGGSGSGGDPARG